jgi:hypothetical protein
MHKQILRSLLYRLGPFGAAALIFVLAGAPSALAGTGPNEVKNPGFETGTFSDWAGGGSFGAYAGITRLNAHSGSFSAVIGYPYRPANIDTVIAQYVHVPVIQPRLTFFIRPQCSTPSDSFQVVIRDMFIPSVVSVPIRECTTSNAWVPRTVDMSGFAGRYVELRFEVISFGFGTTFTGLDDVSLT